MNDLDSLDTSQVLARAEEAARHDEARESDERWALVCELHRRGGRPAFEQGVAWCGSLDPLLRCLGADVLGQLGFVDKYPFADEATPTLVALLDDAEVGVVSAALVALGHLGTGDCAAICALVAHDSEDVRHAVAYCLGTRDEPVARHTLIILSGDSDPDVRNWATFGLGTLSDVDSEEIRLALVAGLSDADSDVRGEAMRGLALRRDARAEEAILHELRGPDCTDLAIEAASELRSERLLASLEALLEANPEAEHIRLAIDECRKEKPAV